MNNFRLCMILHNLFEKTSLNAKPREKKNRLRMILHSYECRGNITNSRTNYTLGELMCCFLVVTCERPSDWTMVCKVLHVPFECGIYIDMYYRRKFLFDQQTLLKSSCKSRNNIFQLYSNLHQSTLFLHKYDFGQFPQLRVINRGLVIFR